MQPALQQLCLEGQYKRVSAQSEVCTKLGALEQCQGSFCLVVHGLVTIAQLIRIA